MDKNAIKKYAVWARKELIARVTQKALQYGIEKENIIDASADIIHGKLLTVTEQRQRQALIAQVEEKGFDQVMEEVAYTWFNRFIALRFMEVNGYLPSRIRVFTDEENQFKPQILAEAIHLEFDELDMEKVYALKEADETEELFKYLLIIQCNDLNEVLPQMFQRIADYTEMLLPDNLLREGSVVEQLVTTIPEDDWKDAVQIIGWLYQFYNIEPKATVFAKGGKISKDEVPAATQLFTPDWIVRYMVENSLGRLWIEGHPNDELKSSWKYYLEEAEQEDDVKVQLDEICKEYAKLNPSDIKIIDPCMGSGHILVYAFDVLMQIYLSMGYSEKDAAISILENNLYGLDIDERAFQLAYFAVMMKARQYHRFILKKRVKHHLYAIAESNGVKDAHLQHFGTAMDELSRNVALPQMQALVNQMKDAKEYGSILTIDNFDWELLRQFASEFDTSQEMSLFTDNGIKDTQQKLKQIIDIGEILARQYDVVVTNPPYMGGSNMNLRLSQYVKNKYPNSKADLFAVFIERCAQMTEKNRYQAMITMQSWMFLSSFEKLRAKIIDHDIVNMVHLGARAFEEIGGEVVQTTSFVFRKSQIRNLKGKYCRLIDAESPQNKEEMFLLAESKCEQSKENFTKIPGNPIAYWASEAVYSAYQNNLSLGSIAAPRKGNSTSDNSRFLRLWYEVNYLDIRFCCKELIREETIEKRWYPYNKGGGYRKWYGFKEYLIDWYDDAAAIRAIKTAVIANYQYFMKPGLTWSTLASKDFSIRWFDEGYIFDNGGCCIFELGEKRAYICALLNSAVFKYIFGQLNPTLNFQSGEVAKFPVIYKKTNMISEIALECVELSEMEYNSFETSWDFRKHPLVPTADEWEEQRQSQFANTRVEKFSRLAWHYDKWEQECQYRFNQLKANEEELNRIFIDIYGLKDELTPKVEDKDVTVRLADKKRDIKSLISYAVGCMFGRYSLDMEGLAYAGGEWDDSKYVTFQADKDNIIPICDDEYFSDDIVGRFVRFIEVVYGQETLGENLRFIADALGGNGQPKDVIRKYFMDEFYTDHLKIYQKRPIYWQFDSGKKGGFKALIYMHRYQPDTIARMRTDYVHEQQARYRTTIDDLQQRISVASASDRVKLNKALKKVQDQATEIHGYEEKIHHLADKMIRIDLDDGVKKNYEIFKDVLAKIK